MKLFDIPVPQVNLGDVFTLGKHRLMCGDATSMDHIKTLINGVLVDMVLTDPPYGIKVQNKNGKVGGGSFGRASSLNYKTGLKARSYSIFEGDNDTGVAIAAIGHIKTINPKVQIIWGGNYFADQLPASSCWIVWDKVNGTTDFADAELAWTNQKTAVRIFKHMWNGVCRASEPTCHGPRIHPTQKPIALSEWCMGKYGEKAGTVLDLFGGSGSTLMACEKLGKSCLTMEIMPYYCGKIIERWQNTTGKIAAKLC